MYSGYYQHEIKANLVDPEKLFEAMGYKLMPNQTLVLEGAICPGNWVKFIFFSLFYEFFIIQTDQVTNVARDAMAAYVECEVSGDFKSGHRK
jgi:spermatogenesis-associated protein 2